VSLVVQGPVGTVTVPGAVLETIAAKAAESVEGVRVRRRRTVDVEAGEVRLGIAARRGDVLSSVGEQVQEQVAGAIRAMCGLEVTVEVSIEELQ
jgi:uncharacterized alkaline shock family protein YloU